MKFTRLSVVRDDDVGVDDAGRVLGIGVVVQDDVRPPHPLVRDSHHVNASCIFFFLNELNWLIIKG